MKPASGEENDNTVVIRAQHRNEEGRKCVEKIELKTRNPETVKHVERKLMDQGVQRMERHPADGIPIKRSPPKSGHGGKYTWEGPDDMVRYELEPDPPAVDEGDPNYVEEETVVEEEEKKGGGESATELVVGEVEVAKEAPEGLARVEVDPRLVNHSFMT